ncbi:MAG: hypothetical protein QM775_17555 [Pirellulales bacterium]
MVRRVADVAQRSIVAALASRSIAALLRPLAGPCKMYDQAVGVLGGLEPADVVDPASLLFYQAAAYHHQLRKTPGLRAPSINCSTTSATSRNGFKSSPG